MTFYERPRSAFAFALALEVRRAFISALSIGVIALDCTENRGLLSARSFVPATVLAEVQSTRRGRACSVSRQIHLVDLVDLLVFHVVGGLGLAGELVVSGFSCRNSRILCRATPDPRRSVVLWLSDCDSGSDLCRLLARAPMGTVRRRKPRAVCIILPRAHA